MEGQGYKRSPDNGQMELEQDRFAAILDEISAELHKRYPEEMETRTIQRNIAEKSTPQVIHGAHMISAQDVARERAMGVMDAVLLKMEEKKTIDQALDELVERGAIKKKDTREIVREEEARKALSAFFEHLAGYKYREATEDLERYAATHYGLKGTEAAVKECATLLERTFEWADATADSWRLRLDRDFGERVEGFFVAYEERDAHRASCPTERFRTLVDRFLLPAVVLLAEKALSTDDATRFMKIVDYFSDLLLGDRAASLNKERAPGDVRKIKKELKRRIRALSTRREGDDEEEAELRRRGAGVIFSIGSAVGVFKRVDEDSIRRDIIGIGVVPDKE